MSNQLVVRCLQLRPPDNEKLLPHSLRSDMLRDGVSTGPRWFHHPRKGATELHTPVHLVVLPPVPLLNPGFSDRHESVPTTTFITRKLNIIICGQSPSIEPFSRRYSRIETISPFESLNHTHMDISRSESPNTRQLIIEGETVTIPADPVQSFRSIRTQTLASYRAIVSGPSTARDHALIFGIVTAADTSDTQGAAEGITIPDTASPRRSSEHQCSKRPRPNLPARGPELSQRYWAMKKGFIGDFTDPWDANTKTSMSLTWVKGSMWRELSRSGVCLLGVRFRLRGVSSVCGMALREFVGSLWTRGRKMSLLGLMRSVDTVLRREVRVVCMIGGRSSMGGCRGVSGGRAVCCHRRAYQPTRRKKSAGYHQVSKLIRFHRPSMTKAKRTDISALS